MQALVHPEPTPHADLNQVLADLTRSVAAILGENFHAACLQGSFAMGDFDRYSDVDFLVVTNQELSEITVPGLQAMHGRIFDGPSQWARHLEGSYIPKFVLRTPAAADRPLWYLDHGSRSLMRSAHCNTVVVRCIVREHGVGLAGPDPRSLVDPIPVAVLREVLATMHDWVGSDAAEASRQITSVWYQSFVVVSYCRMLHTVRTGHLGSKLAGIRWALAHLDPRWRGLIEQAWAERPDPATKARRPPDPQAVGATLAFVQYVRSVARAADA